VAVQTYIIRSDRDRGYAAAAAMRAPTGMAVIISKPKRTADQNAKLHACLTDVAGQLGWPPDTGELHDVEVWKRRCTLSWLIETHQQPEVITALNDTERYGILIPHTSDLDTEQCAALIEWVYAFGAQNGVVFKEPKDRSPEPPPHEEAI
jgi:hypothetical protein